MATRRFKGKGRTFLDGVRPFLMLESAFGFIPS